MKIQAYLTAAAINLKRLQPTFSALLLRWVAQAAHPQSSDRAGVLASSAGP
jgi:hypothetical protein